jgi:hypothetical protein
MSPVNITTQSVNMHQLLLENECIVEFVKVNGEVRSMPCTLKPDLIPPQQPLAEGKEPKKPNPNVTVVWCTDKKEWRSFRTDSLISITVKDDSL